MSYSWDNCMTRELNRRLLQPPISVYHTLCSGYCCPLQPSAMFRVLCPAKKDILHQEPQCVPDCPSRVRTWSPQQGLAAPAGTCWLPPWRCCRGFGMAGEPTSPRVLWWDWLMAEPYLQCNEPVSSLFLEGSGWVPFGLFPMPFILWKRQQVLWSSGLPMSPDVWGAAQHHLETSFLGPSPSKADPVSTHQHCWQHLLQTSPENSSRAPNTCQFLFSQRLCSTRFYLSFPALWQPFVPLTHQKVSSAQGTWLSLIKGNLQERPRRNIWCPSPAKCLITFINSKPSLHWDYHMTYLLCLVMFSVR